MAQSPAPEVTVTLESVSSHPTTLIDQIESILTSPSAFTTSTPTALFPFLEQLQYEDQDDEGQERIVRVVKWCEQLDDAVTAANARQVITMYLEEVRSWPEWTYSTTAEAVGKRNERVEEIKRSLAELPIEWLKSRVTELRRREGELHPPAYLTIHITFSLLPPLSTLSAQLQIYTVRFRIFDISLRFFSIISALKSFLSIPFPQRNSAANETASTEALALSIEAGLLLDKMIDISIEHKSTPIPDEWIEEFEQIEQLVTKITQEDVEREETPSPAFVPGHGGGEEDERPRITRDRTRESLVESVFSSPERGMDDSMSSIEDDLPEHLQIKLERSVDDDEEGQPSLVLEEAGDDRDGEDGIVEDISRFCLEDELEKDDNKLFDTDKEYHAISTPPPADISEEIDHSPFLQRVIAELENLDPFESLHITLDEVEDPPIERKQEDTVEKPVFETTQPGPNDVDQEPDIDALYNEIEIGSDSEDGEPLSSPPLRPKIRTSSPIFEDDEPNYAELESDDEEDINQPQLENIEDFDPAPEDVDVEMGLKAVLLDTIDGDGLSDDDDVEGDRTERLTRIDLNPFDSPNKQDYPSHLLTLDPPLSFSSHDDHLEDENHDLQTSHDTTFDTLDPDSDIDDEGFSSPDVTITLPPPTHTSPRKHPHLTNPLPPGTSSPLHKSHLHTKVTAIAHSHPSVQLIPQTSSFRPFSRSEYATYTLHPRRDRSPHTGSPHYATSTSNGTHSRASSVSSEGAEARKVDMGGVNLYVRILSDRVMVRVGGGWVDLDQYLREYIGKREVTNRRRSGSVEPLQSPQNQQSPPPRNSTPTPGAMGGSPGLYVRPVSNMGYYRDPSLSPGIEGYEFLEIEEKGQFGRKVSTPIQRAGGGASVGGGQGTGIGEGRCVSSLGISYSPPRQGGRNSSFEVRRSVSPSFSDFDGSLGGGIGGVTVRSGSVTRRVFVRRK